MFQFQGIITSDMKMSHKYTERSKAVPKKSSGLFKDSFVYRQNFVSFNAVGPDAVKPRKV